jgi:hypothetical protein
MSGKIDRRNRRLIAATLMLVIALAGCTASTRIEPGVTWVNSGEQRIVSTAAGFKATRPIRVKYTDAWQTEEYALFRADGRQGEMIYAEANRAFTVALDYQMPIEEMVLTWNLNSRQNLIWGPLGRIDRRFGTWFYRPYKISDLQRPCVGFMVEWDQIHEDPQGRPGKVLFGYFCGSSAETLEDQEIRVLIGGFGVRMLGESTGEQQAALLPNAGSEIPPAIAAARGDGPSAESGNPGFPFMFAHYYSMKNGGKLK